MRALVRVIGVVAVFTLTAGMCSHEDDFDDEAHTVAYPPLSTTRLTTTTSPPVDVVSVYFLADGTLRVGHGRRSDGQDPVAAAVTALLDGPVADDVALGLTSSVPAGATLRGLDLDDDVVIVDLSAEFGAGDGSPTNAALAQLVYTVTHASTAREVVVRIDGVDVAVLGAEGQEIDRPLTRADFEPGGAVEHLTPAILLETPRPGEMVADLVRGSGRASVSDDRFWVELVDPVGGAVISEGIVLAPSGAASTGSFTIALALPSSFTGSVTLVAFERPGGRDERVNDVEVPLVVGG